jgi:hypothetical protein
MKKLARIFGFGEERRTADAVRSKRKRNVRENLQTTFTKQPKQEDSKRHLLITDSKQDLVGVLGMGGATKKLKHSMAARHEEAERSGSLFVQARAPGDVPRPTESGVFVTSARAIDLPGYASSPAGPAKVDTRAIEEVTLIVYGWENVQPGTLSWVFPSLRSALAAVRAMRNAVRWAVLDGVEADEDVESARESGRVLVEAS